MNQTLTEKLIADALATEPMRADTGERADWLYFATEGPVETEVRGFGPKGSPEKIRASFWHGKRRLSRKEAEAMIAGSAS